MKNIKKNICALKIVIVLTFFYLQLSSVNAQQFYPSNFDVTTLNGINGFVIPGIDPQSQFGAETKFIGDINNDGFEDIGIGVNNADINGLNLAGAAYIIFGTNTGFPASFDITTLNGTNGFAVEGVAGSTRMGNSVEGVGDINGDSIDDLIIVSSGDTMVIYGKTTPFSATFNIGYADGINGFLIQDGRTINEVGALGDVNGDGINDFILSRANFSRAWIVFGRSTNFPPIINASWLDGANGFQTQSYSNSSIPAFLAGGAGDINKDGINDIVIGDWSSGSGAPPRTHLIYGRNTFQPQINLETMSITEGFTIDHTGGNFLAFTGSLGDINGDGIDDFFSEKAAIYGKEQTDPFPGHIPLSSISDGTYGFTLPGGLTSTSIGDINQDGINDFISVYGTGSGSNAYIIFGSTTGFPNPINETTLNGMNGFVIDGFRTSNIGRPISGNGDINGDGIADFIIGNPFTTPQGSTSITGEAYVIFGGDHYAMPLNTTYPQVINETTSGFNLVVNGPETGRVQYAIFPGNFSITVNHNSITGGVGAVANGNFLMNIANTDIEEIISSLAEATTYDVYLFLEDAAGNKGEIYHIDNVTTLSSVDTTPPVIICPANQELPCASIIPDYRSLVTTTDNMDPSPVVTQSPVAGSAFVDGMTITMTATDTSSNSDSCTFIVTKGVDTNKPILTCLTSETLFVNSTLPNYFLKLRASDNCTSIFDFTYTQTPIQGTVFTADTNVIVTVSDKNGNTETCSFLVTVRPPVTPIDCTTTAISTNDLDGSNGFQIDGNKIKGEAGYDVRGAGDINGDGMEDFLVGAPGKAYNMNLSRGRERGNFPGDVFVIFGKGNDFLPNLDTALLDGTNGFRIANDIPGGVFQFSGYQVSTAGDINNDGIDDLMFSDPFRNDGLGAERGVTYVVFGKTSGFPAVFNVSEIDGTNGFVFMGADAYDQSALSLDSAGDINNDGINDIIIGARAARFTNNSGKCYIIYGKSTTFPALIEGDDLNGTNGFIIKGDADGEGIGNGVAGLGDVNGDGIDDVGFNGGNTNKTYILFGKTGGFSSVIATATINGITGFYVDVSSFSSKNITGVGDVNNDGINDILFGNKRLFFGKNTGFSVAEDITSLDGTNGVEFTGNYRISSAGGDFNKDGIGDLIVGRLGSIVIIYGKNTPWSPTLNPFSLPLSEAFVIDRINPRDYSVSDLGDINGDGITDVIIGEKETLYYDSSSSLDPGHAYVVYGFSVSDTEPPVITCPSDQVLASGSILPDYTTLATVTDNCDTAP
ncbi:HYR domain-containing protein, partial [Aquimarina muelleri]|uniref:HYR domain-containing protein n=2 Tax=Aquimarina muelleri TaxID=279356 RepID=UPI002248F4A9